jgi:hypothetical protein
MCRQSVLGASPTAAMPVALDVARPVTTQPRPVAEGEVEKLEGQHGPPERATPAP